MCRRLDPKRIPSPFFASIKDWLGLRPNPFPICTHGDILTPLLAMDVGHGPYAPQAQYICYFHSKSDLHPPCSIILSYLLLFPPYYLLLFIILILYFTLC